MQVVIDGVMPYILATSIAIPRLMAALYLIPIFSVKLVKGMLRNSIIVALALPIGYPLVEQLQGREIGMLMLAIMALKEAVLGLAIGFLLAIPFWIFQAIGVMIDQQRGALAGGYFNPGAGPDNSMLGDAFIKVLGMLLIATGSFPALFTVIVETYQLWPVLEWTPKFSPDAIDVFIYHIGQFAYKFVLYSGPIVFVLLLVEAAFAILGAYAPQLQVYFMAMPAKALVALLVLALYFGTLWHLGATDLAAYLDLKSTLPDIFIPFEAQH